LRERATEAAGGKDDQKEGIKSNNILAKTLLLLT
jgi:hypothetical protein